jgi:hypothetical protein
VKPASDTPAPRQADHSLDFNSLAYRDPTADSAIRNMLPGRYQITHESGLRFWIDSDSLRPLLEQCETRIARRTGRTHLHLKSKNPGTAPTVTGENNRTSDIQKEKRIVNHKTTNETPTTAIEAPTPKMLAYIEAHPGWGDEPVVDLMRAGFSSEEFGVFAALSLAAHRTESVSL